MSYTPKLSDWEGLSPIVKLTEYERGYLSAWLDTDGFVSIAKQKRYRSTGGFDFRPTIGFCNTNKDVILFIKQLINEKIDGSEGTIQTTGPSEQRFGLKPVWKLQFSETVTYALLKILRLVGKEQQQKTLLEAAALKQWNREYEFGRHYPLMGRRIKNRLEELYIRNKRLNEVGNNGVSA